MLGDDEIASGSVGIKFLREDREQESVAREALAARLQALLAED